MAIEVNNLNIAPYFDDYDSAKQYTQILAVPGRVAQAREFTQLQSILKGIIKSIGDSIFKEGNVIEGCQVLVSTNENGVKYVRVTPGKVYIQGMVLPVPDSQVQIRGTGSETVGIKLVEYAYTEFDDSKLRDPAQGYDNHNEPGSHRLKSTTSVVVNDPDSAIIATLLDGELALENPTPEYDIITQTLARRTHDESGSYIVDGLSTRVERIEGDENNYNVVVEAGKVYVLGYELKIPTARRIKVPRSKTTSYVPWSRTYHDGIKDYILSSDHPFVESIVSVTGTERVSTSLTMGNSNSSSQTLSGLVQDIESVTQGDRIFEKDVDYVLKPLGNTSSVIQWQGTSNHPSLNDSYDIVYKRRKTFEQGKDYELSLINGAHYISWIDGGSKPIDDSAFDIPYNQYLARRDVVYIDKYGNISVATGTPAEFSRDTVPETPLNTLTLAIINNPPNGDVYASEDTEAITVENVGLKRFTMNDIQNILNRVKTIEYDQANLSLNEEAKNDIITGKKGIFTDPLIDISRIDTYFNRVVKINDTIPVERSVLFDIALDLSSNIAYLPIITRTNSLSYNSSSSTSKLNNRLITLGTTGEEIVLLSQNNATGTFLVNPYTSFPQMPEISVTPAVDSWIDDTIIEVPVSMNETSIVSMSTRTIDNRTASQKRNYTTRVSNSVTDTVIGTQTTTYTNETIMSEEAVTYIRQRELVVEGNNFQKGLTDIRGYFDGVPVNLIPMEGTTAGTNYGTTDKPINSVNADDSGHLKAKFRIPAGIVTGTREVLLKSDRETEGIVNEGFTIYIAQGISRTIQRTVTTVNTVLLERVTTTTLSKGVYVDPVGQTFVLDRMSMVKGIDVYFASKSNTVPVTCEIRGVENGIISSQVYAHKLLPASQVIESGDSKAATRFEFDDPVLLEENKEYAFVIRSVSNEYSIWVAELGEIEHTTKNSDNPQQILKNPYMTGVMMSSSNNSTWTAHQTTDIKFRIISEGYELSSEVIFNPLRKSDIEDMESFSRLYLSADSAIPPNTNLSWSYSVDGGVSYISVSPYELLNLGTLADEVLIKASISRDSSVNLSPMIALDTLEMTTSCYDINEGGYYVMKNIPVTDERDDDEDKFTSIKVLVDTYEPEDTSVRVYYCLDDNSEGKTLNLYPMGDPKESKPLNYNWRECSYIVENLEPSHQFRIFMKFNSGNASNTPAIRRVRVIVA